MRRCIVSCPAEVKLKLVSAAKVLSSAINCQRGREEEGVEFLGRPSGGLQGENEVIVMVPISHWRGERS